MVIHLISFDLEHFYTPDVCSQHSLVGFTSLEAEAVGECDRDIQVQQHKSYVNVTVVMLAQAEYPAVLHHVDLWACVSTSSWISALDLLLDVGTHIFADACVQGVWAQTAETFCTLPFPALTGKEPSSHVTGSFLPSVSFPSLTWFLSHFRILSPLSFWMDWPGLPLWSILLGKKKWATVNLRIQRRM